MPIARRTASRIFSSLLAHNTSMAPRSDRGSPFSSGEGRPKGKSVDQPHAKQIAPAEGVTPPAEVHACPTVHSAPCTIRYRCLPTGVTGSRSRPTPPGFGQIVHAKQIAPAEGVTPPPEVHACPTVHSAPCTTRYRCLPTGVTGSRSRPTPPGSGQI